MKTTTTSLVPLAALALAAPLAAGGSVCVEETPLTGVGGSDLDFGHAVAIDGDLAIVCDDTEAYAYHWTGTAWVQEEVLSILGAESGFGTSVALDGNTAVIGCPYQDGAFADTGRALVFVRSGAGTWSLEDVLIAADAQLNDQFGWSVALEGDRALVGAPREDLDGPDTGSVYVFERSGTLWSEAAKLSSLSSESVRFGTSLALSGDTAVIGSALFIGGSYVYRESGGIWTEEGQLATSQILSSSVAIDGDVAVVGGVFETLIYQRTGSLWNEVDSIATTGTTVAIDGSRLVIGGASCPSTPAASLYVENGGSWDFAAELPIAGSTKPVDVSGSRIAIGTTGGLSCPGGLASIFRIGTGTAPAVAFRNAGTNPVSYTAVSASYGGTLEFTIDLTTTGHSMGLVIGFDSPFGFTLGGGQTLLCLDLLGSGGELINTGFFPGPVAEISLAVPNDPVFEGFSVCTQAIHAFGVVPFALSNAQDIVIGGCQ